MIRLNATYTGIEAQCWKDGVPADPDATPTAILYRDGVATAQTVTVTSTSDTGRYLLSFTTLGAGAGWTVTDHLTVRVVAVIATTPYPALVFDSFSHPPQVADASVVSVGDSVITAAAIASNAIDADALATDAVTEIQGTIPASVTAIKTQTDKLVFTNTGRVDSTVIDKTGFSLSAGGVQAVWDALTSALTTAGSVGKRISDFVNASIAAIPTTDNTVNIGAIKTQTDKFVFTTAGRVDATAVGVPTADNTTAIAAIKAKTDQFAFTTAGRVDSSVIDKTGFSLGSSQSFNLTGNITGNLSGSVGSVAGAVTLPTIPTDWISAAGVSAGAVTKIQNGLSTYAGGDTNGTSLLLGRLTSTRAGYLDNLNFTYTAPDNTAIATIKAKTDQIVFTAANRIDATAIDVPTNPLLTNDSRLNSLDAAISSRMATFVYTAPPTVSQIWTGFTSGTVAANLVSQFQFGLSTYAGGDTNGTSLLLSRLTNTRAGYLDNLANYVAPDNTAIANINTRTARLDGLLVNPGSGDRFSTTALSNAPMGSSISAADVWAYNDRSLSAGGGTAIAQTVWNFSTDSVTIPGKAGRQLNRLAKVHGLTAASVTASGSARTTSDGAIAQTITTNNDGSKTMSGAE